jgi:hypothetical protein
MEMQIYTVVSSASPRSALKKLGEVNNRDVDASEVMF